MAKQRVCVPAVYVIRNVVTGRLYVGSGVNYSVRRSKHRKDLEAGRHHNVHLQSAWNMYGPEAFIWEILEVVEDKATLREREQIWIDRLGAADRDRGYNLAPKAGSLLDFKMPEAGKERIRAALTGKPKTEKHRAAMRGKRGKRGPVSDQVRANMRAASADPALRAKRSAAQTARWAASPPEKRARQHAALLAGRRAKTAARKVAEAAAQLPLKLAAD